MFDSEERYRRWRLVLGQEPAGEQSSSGEGDEGQEGGQGLSSEDQMLDKMLETLYGDGEEGDLSDSAPDIARWLGDIRGYFPDNIVHIMQRDALQRFKLRELLDQPELLAAIEPDVSLVADILALKKVMPV
ncbi:MAG: hypothetical protein ACK2UR_19875, partial [Candidatus Promineifilaceae bacterium]